eukprot:341612-Pyramimonas_sp.AAC.1
MKGVQQLEPAFRPPRRVNHSVVGQTVPAGGSLGQRLLQASTEKASTWERLRNGRSGRGEGRSPDVALAGHGAGADLEDLRLGEV